MTSQVSIRIDRLPGNISSRDLGNKIAAFLRSITSTPVNLNINEEDHGGSLGNMAMLRTLNRGITMNREEMNLNEIALFRE